MLYPLWTAKPGSGCSTISLALAARLAAKRDLDVLVVDLDGDLTAAAGVAPRHDGVTDWLAAGSVGSDALHRLEVELRPRLSLLPVGSSHAWPDDRADTLVRALHADPRLVVVDVSTVTPHALSSMQRLRHRLAADDPSLLVTRSRYLAVRRAQALPIRPTGVVLVREGGRTFDRHLIAEALGAPVVAQIDHDPAVARAVDDGKLVRRPPRPLSRQVEALVR